MRAGKGGKLAILEPIVLFGLILAYIWGLRYHFPAAWALILALPVLSHWWRGEGAAGLGFRVRGLADCVRRFAPALGFFSLALVASGLLLDTVRPVPLERAAMAWAIYLPWGLFQQYLLNGFLANRLAEFVGSPRSRLIPLSAAALFSLVHLPNWFLMAVTFTGGYLSVRIYQRYRSLYVLGIAHALIAFTLFLAIPDSVSAHFLIGPRCLIERHGAYPEWLP